SQPAKTVIPIPHAADAFRKRCCSGGDDPPGWGVGQRLQRDERALDRFRPRSDNGTTIAPLPPGRFAARQGIEGIDRWWGILKRGSIGEDKRNGLISLDYKFA